MANKKIKTLLIGTTNESKYRMYSELLSFLRDYSIRIRKLSDEIKPSCNIAETLDDLELNAIKKAVTYARHTGLITIADDTGFFIPALNNEPGVAVRRWGGKLPKNISDKDWEKYFLHRIQQTNIVEPICIKRQVYACSNPIGNYRVIEQYSIGRIKIPGSGHCVKGSPMSSYFFIEQCNRFESDLTKEERINIFSDLRLKTADIIFDFLFAKNIN